MIQYFLIFLSLLLSFFYIYKIKNKLDLKKKWKKYKQSLLDLTSSNLGFEELEKSFNLISDSGIKLLLSLCLFFLPCLIISPLLVYLGLSLELSIFMISFAYFQLIFQK